MIIERKYVRFVDLINTDEKSKDIFMNAFEKSYGADSNESKAKIFEMLSNQCLYQKDMNWCFHYLNEVIDGFDELDKLEPYDNRFTYSDVNKIDIVNKSDESIEVHLINAFEGVERIIAVKDIN